MACPSSGQAPGLGGDLGVRQRQPLRPRRVPPPGRDRARPLLRRPRLDRSRPGRAGPARRARCATGRPGSRRSWASPGSAWRWPWPRLRPGWPSRPDRCGRGPSPARRLASRPRPGPASGRPSVPATPRRRPGGPGPDAGRPRRPGRAVRLLRPGRPGGDDVAWMLRFSDRLRYRGADPLGPELARLRAEGSPDPDPDRDRALAWHEQLRRFADDRPLPADFARHHARSARQLEALAWSFHLDPSTLAGGDPRRPGRPPGPIRPGPPDPPGRPLPRPGRVCPVPRPAPPIRTGR